MHNSGISLIFWCIYSDTVNLTLMISFLIITLCPVHLLYRHKLVPTITDPSPLNPMTDRHVVLPSPPNNDPTVESCIINEEYGICQLS